MWEAAAMYGLHGTREVAAWAGGFTKSPHAMLFLASPWSVLQKRQTRIKRVESCTGGYRQRIEELDGQRTCTVQCRKNRA